jgi:ribokinase
MPEPARVSVVGSLNLDLVARVSRLPRDGETLLARGYDRALGGKGANQAISAARHGVTVAMIGCVGDDPDGSRLTAALAAQGVDVSGVRVRTDAPAGVAHVAVDADGANSIVVVPGANGLLGPGDVRRELDRLPPADVVLIQLEIPLDAVIAAAATTGARIVLNPAPARSLPHELLQHVDVLVPNLPELSVLTGGAAPTSIEQVADRGGGLADGRVVVVTLGERGALILDTHGATHVPAPQVNAIDTTGAGDAFCGSLAAQLARGRSLVDAVRDAVHVAALSTTRHGALPAAFADEPQDDRHAAVRR